MFNYLVSSTFFETKGLFSGRRLYIQVWYSVFTWWNCCNYCYFSTSNIPAVPNGQTGRQRGERRDEMRLKFVFSTAVPHRS